MRELFCMQVEMTQAQQSTYFISCNNFYATYIYFSPFCRVDQPGLRCVSCQEEVQKHTQGVFMGELRSMF